MSKITIELFGIQAFTDGGPWESADKRLEQMLNSVAGLNEVDRSDYIPDMAKSLLNLAQKAFPRAIVISEIKSDKSDRDAVY